MTTTYIDRRLVLTKSGNDSAITQAELKSDGLPLVILGDPGLGKTWLTEALEREWGVRRISAGAFCRQPASAFAPKPSAIIIDGLDELALSSGKSAVDEVLKKLGLIDYPPFVLSCRAADWNGVADRHKIKEDYGAEPVVARLLPFNREEAEALLTARRLDGEKIIQDLERLGLDDFYGNALTLSIIAEIVQRGGALPTTRATLLQEAASLLVQEKNPLHQRSVDGKAPVAAMLDSAGAVFAHLLLSGSLGVADMGPADAPLGYIPNSEIAGLHSAPLAQAVLKSRLFQGVGENLLGPYHRVVAEYLAGQWLARQLDNRVSERRAYQALTFAGGVPTALRGLHAWFGHFAPTMVGRCIRTDPYGMLRYGDIGSLPPATAKLLLQALGALAEEDPYFRSEDWGKQALGGLARVELKDDIVALLKRKDRPIHLSTLVLEAAGSSPLAQQIVPDLQAILEDPNAAYIERFNAGEALLAAELPIDWPALLGRVRALGDDDSQRLNLELIGHQNPNQFPPNDLADGILEYYGVLEDERPRSVIGASYLLIKKLSPATAAQVLDSIYAATASKRAKRYWRLGSSMASQVFDMIARALDRNPRIEAPEFWRWLRLIEGERGLNEEERKRIADFLSTHGDVRRDIQRLAFSDKDIDGGPWTAVCMELPRCCPALSITTDDAVFYLDELAQKEQLNEIDLELWESLVRCRRGREGVESEIAAAAQRGVDAHPALEPRWNELKEPPNLSWEERERQREERAARKKKKRQEGHRIVFAKQKDDIASGKAFGRLYEMANAYLGHYYDLERDAGPRERVEDWLGPELSHAAFTGFVAALHRDDLPSAKKIGESHAEGRTFNAEVVLIAGVNEHLRTAGSLEGIPRETLRAALAAWNEMPDHYAQQIGTDIGPLIESAVFISLDEMLQFFSETMEPSIKAGKEHVSLLYALCREDRFRAAAGPLSVRWLSSFPDAHPSVQDDLIRAALSFGPREAVLHLVRERLAAVRGAANPLRALWVAASFIVDFEATKAELADIVREDKSIVWALRDVVQGQRGEAGRSLSTGQLEFIVREIGAIHPPSSHPSGAWWGDENSWDASDFVNGAIKTLGANASGEASEALERLATDVPASPYRDQIRHARATQAKLRRDTDFKVPNFAQTVAMLDNRLPETIDDLKAVVLDAMADAQVYLRTGDTMAWNAFWDDGKPLNENSSRDRFLDVLRWNLPKAINAIPETLMPDRKRADIAVLLQQLGLPVEAKGQWHPKVWDAPSDQLISLYSKDYRANGRGIYLVFWFGPAPGKALTTPPGGSAVPTTPKELQEMLYDRLKPEDRERVAVVVIDVSPTV